MSANNNKQYFLIFNLMVLTKYHSISKFSFFKETDNFLPNRAQFISIITVLSCVSFHLTDLCSHNIRLMQYMLYVYIYIYIYIPHINPSVNTYLR
jgi:hypothetical protein